MFKLPKATTAQAALLHLVESLVASIVLTVIVGAVQYISVHGLAWSGLEVISVSTFLGALSMAYKSVSSNPNFGQAVLDTSKEVKQLVPGIDVGALALQLAQEVAKIRMSDVQPGAGQKLPTVQSVQQNIPQRPVLQQQQQAGPQPIVFPPNPAAGSYTPAGLYGTNVAAGQGLQSFNLATQQTGVQPTPPFPLSPGQQQQSGRGG